MMNMTKGHMIVMIDGEASSREDTDEDVDVKVCRCERC